MMLCERATLHKDQTISLVRAGIAIYRSPYYPAAMDGYLGVSIPPGALPAGKHQVEAFVLSPGGEKGYIMEGEASIRADKHVMMPIGVAIPLMRPGLYTVVFRVGELEFRVPLTAQKANP